MEYFRNEDAAIQVRNDTFAHAPKLSFIQKQNPDTCYCWILRKIIQDPPMRYGRACVVNYDNTSAYILVKLQFTNLKMAGISRHFGIPNSNVTMSIIPVTESRVVWIINTDQTYQ